MPTFGGTETSPRTSRCQRFVDLLTVVAISVATAAGLLVTGPRSVQAASPPDNTGFSQPFSGTPRYLYLAPTQAAAQGQVNRPIGQRTADDIARRFGLSKRDTLTTAQYRLLVSGQGIGGDPGAAKLIRQSLAILTNTAGRPLYAKINGQWIPSVLASYGLFVTGDGLLESPANAQAPTRKINALLVPNGYIGTWCRANGATRALARLYRSGYPAEVAFGNRSQQISGAAQLVANNKGAVRGDLPRSAVRVGMSMAPSIWLVNFALIYTVNPRLAAAMPAAWAPIPPVVARALLASPTGQVPYLRFAAAFR